MQRIDIKKQIEKLEKDVEIFVEELQTNKPLTRSRFDLIDELMFILANLQLSSHNMEINKKSPDYRKLVDLSGKISRGR